MIVHREALEFYNEKYVPENFGYIEFQLKLGNNISPKIKDSSRFYCKL